MGLVNGGTLAATRLTALAGCSKSSAWSYLPMLRDGKLDADKFFTGQRLSTSVDQFAERQERLGFTLASHESRGLAIVRRSGRSPQNYDKACRSPVTASDVGEAERRVVEAELSR